MPVPSTIRTVVAALVAATTVVLLPASPAGAAGCSGATGVTVVVDFNQLRGDDLTTGCAGAGGGSDAAEIFPAAGYPLDYVVDSSFVCRVSGYPENAGCGRTPPATAYWSLWWSDGKSGRWTYASRGVAGLKIPTGGYVAFSWHQGRGDAAPPDVAPTPRVSPSTPPAPKPSAKPTAGGGGGGGATKGSGSGKPAKPSATPTASTSASPSASSSASDSASASPTTTPSDPASATSGAPVPTDPGTGDVPSIDEITDGPPSGSDRASGDDTDGGGFPVWLGAVLAVVVLGGAAAVPILRRRG
ncbi:hypothetical protein [Pimelobacter simplex]|uniref:hypothetical protein n=1 Tax=Nocardioides simplex TaxID=2045 RepID=UPI0021502003|nr:hypothetical protein [Pimelobacter simplex]UUW89455.1 hypothetical protein M0M43_27560 [Pimelobacter simplex]UUW93284.1 hypothetical protein M0M48_16215 [Pimelobacter simplex]